MWLLTLRYSNERVVGKVLSKGASSWYYKYYEAVTLVVSRGHRSPATGIFCCTRNFFDANENEELNQNITFC